MTTEKLDQLFAYVEERCLWQFSSRTWDREENIGGVIAAAACLLTGEQPKAETGSERLFYAEAKTMVADLKARLSWIEGADPAEIKALLQSLTEKLLDVTIVRSKNRELNHSLY
jgi:V-containing nitrogenase delta subunit